MEQALWKVLLRKRGFLRKHLVLTGSQLARLRDLHLITEESYKSLIHNTATSHHVMEQHLKLTDKTKAEQFLRFLKDEVHLIHDEVRAELRAETRELKIDELALEEASSDIHRHFGRSRRLSEQDKKTMTSLVATRSQVAKVVWQRRLVDVSNTLDGLRLEMAAREDDIRVVTEVMETFLKQNHVELYDFSRDMKSTSQILLEIGYRGSSGGGGGGGGVGGGAIVYFVRQVTRMLDRFNRVMFEKESLLQQKKRCMEVLERTDVDTPLDQMVQQKLGKLAADGAENAHLVGELKANVERLEHGVRRSDREVGKLQRELTELKTDSGRCRAVGQLRPQYQEEKQLRQRQQQQQLLQTQVQVSQQQKQQQRVIKQKQLRKSTQLRSIKEPPTNQLAAVLTTSGSRVSLPKVPPSGGQMLTATGSLKGKSADDRRNMILKVK